MEKRIHMKILETFPAIREIQDSELREKVIKAWVRALREGSFKNIEDIPFSVAIPEVDLVNHINWVMEAALSTASLVEKNMGISIDRDLLIASVVLHDLGKAFEYEKRGDRYVKSDIGERFMHGFWGAFIALQEHLPNDLVHLIATHGKDSPEHPRLLEGIILHYADFAHADILRFRKGLDTFLSMKCRS
ncbi:MAG: HD domain-containing protein [Deltaproteobacteria bacterium]|nr:HD domain-containing protein [Deltaproteobacteria bacterium]MBW2121659.1 HD domain-containing protein [Deltaproteobacteria bacterium]